MLADCDRVTLCASHSIDAANKVDYAVNKMIKETTQMNQQYRDHVSKFDQLCLKRLRSPEVLNESSMEDLNKNEAALGESLLKITRQGVFRTNIAKSAIFRKHN